MGILLRKPETEKAYEATRANASVHDGCALCAKASTNVFTYWKIVPNDFPYDRIAEAHDMIVPLRHVTESALTIEEHDELLKIKSDYLQGYDYIIEGTRRTKSIPQHFHLHLIVGKETLD